MPWTPWANLNMIMSDNVEETNAYKRSVFHVKEIENIELYGLNNYQQNLPMIHIVCTSDSIIDKKHYLCTLNMRLDGIWIQDLIFYWAKTPLINSNSTKNCSFVLIHVNEE